MNKKGHEIYNWSLYSFLPYKLKYKIMLKNMKCVTEFKFEDFFEILYVFWKFSSECI